MKMKKERTTKKWTMERTMMTTMLVYSYLLQLKVVVVELWRLKVVDGERRLLNYEETVVVVVAVVVDLVGYF